MADTTCGLCGTEATGLASIGDTRYCHGDDDTEPTCYEQASRGMVVRMTKGTDLGRILDMYLLQHRQ